MAVDKEIIDQLACLFLEYDDHALYLAPTTSEDERAAIKRCCSGRADGTLNQVVVLMKARTDTEHFQALPSDGVCVCFITGRIVLSGHRKGAPFPSALIYFGNELDRFARYFETIGKTITWVTPALVDWRTL